MKAGHRSNLENNGLVTYGSTPIYHIYEYHVLLQQNFRSRFPFNKSRRAVVKDAATYDSDFDV